MAFASRPFTLNLQFLLKRSFPNPVNQELDLAVVRDLLPHLRLVRHVHLRVLDDPHEHADAHLRALCVRARVRACVHVRVSVPVRSRVRACACVRACVRPCVCVRAYVVFEIEIDAYKQLEQRHFEYKLEVRRVERPPEPLRGDGYVTAILPPL